MELGDRPKVGLVLGAGGIRGCAHAGVFSVLEEAGIRVDIVVGASTGAIFGLELAAGLPSEYLARVARSANPLQMARFHLGRLSPGRSNPIARMLFDAGSSKTFEDLPLKFAVRATDMLTGKPTMIHTGPVLPAVQASIALPGVARPVGMGESFFVDGGFFDTAPVGAARELGAGIVIAVCLGYNYLAPRFLRRRPWTQPLLVRWGQQRRPIRGGWRDQARFSLRLFASSYDPPLPCQDADVAIWPEFDGLSPNSMFGAAFAFQRGVEATRAALPEIQRLLKESGADAKDSA